MFTAVKAQTIQYNYTDPCTGLTETFDVPLDGSSIAVSYYNQINVFTYSDFINGNFEAWANSTYGVYKDVSPCGSLGLTTSFTQTQNSILGVISILNTLSSLDDLSFNDSPKSNKKQKSTKNEKEKSSSSATSTNSTTNTDGNQSTTNQTNGSNTEPTQSTNSGQNQENINQTEGNQSSTNDVNNSNSNTSQTNNSTPSNNTNLPNKGSTGNTTTTETQTTEGKGAVDVTSGGKSTARAENDREKNGGKPTIIGSGDISGFKFNSTDPNNYKINAGFTAVKYNRKASWGILADYTTALFGPNITVFKTFIGKRRVVLLANTLSLSFLPTNTNVYNTFVVGHIENVWKIKLLVVAAASVGYVYNKPFWATAAVAGAMYNYKPKKGRFGFTVMGLIVYAPYVKYYEDVILKSPWVLLPNVGLDVKVSKKFKINLGIGGAYAIEKDMMNYTLTLGSRLLL